MRSEVTAISHGFWSQIPGVRCQLSTVRCQRAGLRFVKVARSGTYGGGLEVSGGVGDKGVGRGEFANGNWGGYHPFESFVGD